MAAGRMKIAVTGGIACGKSLLSRFLNDFGVETLDADDVAHELMPDPAERRRVAAEVFADPAKRRALEARLHPLVKARMDGWLAGAGQDESGNRLQPSTLGPRLRVAIIPLLFEVHWDAEYDIICCVVSSREKQIERMTAMRGYSREEAESRLAAQMDVSEKAAKSQYVIRNDGSAEELREEARRFVGWLEARARANRNIKEA